jgi:hypothetical protein
LRKKKGIVNCEEKDVVNREELNWLLQTIADAETTGGNPAQGEREI